MQKYVSEQANFALYVPKDWLGGEDSKAGFCSLFVMPPDRRYLAMMVFGLDARNDPSAIAMSHLRGLAQGSPDLRVSSALQTHDRARLAFDGPFTDQRLGKRSFLLWVSGQRGEFVLSRIDTPEGEMEAQKGLLLTILTNVFPIKGALEPQSQGTAPVRLPLFGYRLRDGSATFGIPQGWRV